LRTLEDGVLTGGAPAAGTPYMPDGEATGAAGACVLYNA
jgi:hypothetical protein